MKLMRNPLMFAGLMLAAAQISTVAVAANWQPLPGTNTEHIHFKAPVSGQPKGIVILLSGCGGFDGEGLPETTESLTPNRELSDEKRIVSAHYDRVADKLNEAGFIAVRYDHVNRITEKIIGPEGIEQNIQPNCQDVLSAVLEDIDFKNLIAGDLWERLANIQTLAPGRDVHVIGWSLGARGALEAVTNPQHRLENAFASVSLYSPPCISPENSGWAAFQLRPIPASPSFRFLLMYGSSDDIRGVAKELPPGSGNCEAYMQRSQAPVCEQLGSVEIESVDQVEQMHRSEPTGSVTSSLPSPVRCAVAEGAEHSFDVGHGDEGVHFQADGKVNKYDRAAAEAAWELVKANIGIDQ